MLANIIKEKINSEGFLSVAEFMALALGHPEHGYYMGRDPFGKSGDFVTAPEISQMFGELIGIWAADTWMKMGQPSAFALIEAGPGRGTLMADALRATMKVPDFHKALSLHLIETSPVLKAKQKEALAGYEAVWHDSLATIPQGMPLIFIANEFLDALPIQQYIYDGERWQERVISLRDDELIFSRRDTNFDISIDAKEDDIFERAPVREKMLTDLARRIAEQDGAALFIDYGHLKSVAGDTLQAVKGHEYIAPLVSIGEADVTSHVDFGALVKILSEESVNIKAPIDQSEFLFKMGLMIRAEKLIQNAMPEQKIEIMNAVHRLSSGDQMGSLFKVMAFSRDDMTDMAGF